MRPAPPQGEAAVTPPPQGEAVTAALIAVDADTDDPGLRELAGLMLSARHDARQGLAEIRSCLAGESTALGRTDPALLRDVADRIDWWRNAREAFTTAARPVRDADRTAP